MLNAISEGLAMIFNEVFDQCYQQLAGFDRSTREAHERRRYNRALLSLRSQNYFLTTSFTNSSGAAGVQSVGRTQPIERRLIIRGGGINTRFIGQSGVTGVDLTNGADVNLKIMRSGSARAQISKEFLRSSHYVSNGLGQKYELDWLSPWVLDKNEIILVTFEQQSAVATAGQIYNVGFYGVAVDPALRCEETMLADIRQQILSTQQQARYLHLKSEKSAGTIIFPTQALNVRANANTIETPEHMLILGWRRWQLDVKSNTATFTRNTTIKLVVNGGPAFSRLEIPLNALELCGARPDEGWFRLCVPHFLPKGSSLGLAVTTSINPAENPTSAHVLDQYTGEIELLAVTV
jgi:hypothetical protein